MWNIDQNQKQFYFFSANEWNKILFFILNLIFLTNFSKKAIKN